MKTLTLVLCLIAASIASAQARSHHRVSHHHSHRAIEHHRRHAATVEQRVDPCFFFCQSAPITEVARSSEGAAIVDHPAGCPHIAFCGCGVSVRVFGHPVPELFLAWNWAVKFPRTEPHAGAVAVRHHHVFYIEQAYGDGTALAYDPNSGGHQTRVHRISLIGYVVVEPHG
jgi:hypothetical protein